MQEEVIITLVKPKKEVMKSDHDYEATNLTSKVVTDEDALNVQIKQEIDLNSQQDENEIVLCVSPDHDEDKDNHVENNLSHQEQEKVINTDAEVLTNVELQVVVDDESVPIAEIPNCNIKQPEVTGGIINLLTYVEEQQLNTEENEDKLESQDKVDEINCVLKKDPVVTEMDTVLEEQSEVNNVGGLDSSLEVECVPDDSEFVIIDITDYDPEVPTPEDNNINLIENVEKSIDTKAVNEVIKKRTPNTSKDKKELTDSQKRKLLKSLEWKIMKNNLNPSKLPPYMWNSLQQFSKPQRKAFLKKMRTQLLERSKKNERPSTRPQDKPEVFNDLGSTLSHWLSEQWNEGNRKINQGQSFTETQKHQFLKNVQNMVNRDMIDMRNLPPKVWNTMKQLPSHEKKRFLETMTEKQRSRDRPTSNSSRSFGPLSNSLPRRDFKETNHASHSQSRATAWRKNHENQDSKNKLYSFDRDFHNQRLGDSNNSTSHYYSNYQEKNMDRNNSYGSGSSYLSFMDSFQTPKRGDRADFRRSYESECGNRSSYRDGGKYQASPWSSDAGGSNSTNNSRMQVFPNYNNPSNRKSPDASSYNQPQPKRSKIEYDKSPNKPQDQSVSAVINDLNNPRGTMNVERAALLSSELIRRIDDASLSASGYIPRFNKSGLSQSGEFKINCTDQRSFDWLSTMVSTLPELWNGANLHVLPISSKLVSVSFFVPNSCGEENSNTIILRLERQNPGLSTGSWKVFRQYKNPRGQMFFFDIDERSEQVLKTMNYKVFLGLSSVKVNIEGQKKKGKH